MEIEILIKEVEDRWLNELAENCKVSFSNISIPSHNHTHHMRVWKYAKEIVKEINTRFEYTRKEIEQLIFAVFFHDIGLIVDRGEKHGFFSAGCFEKYTYKLDNYFSVKEKDEIYNAILQHDLKGFKENINLERNKLSTVLTVSDDLDAFGYLGIYRYIEIYHIRGIKHEELPSHVIRNLELRYINFEKIFSSYPELITHHNNRYKCISEYFERLNESFINNISTTERDAFISIIRLVDQNIDISDVNALNAIENNLINRIIAEIN